MWKILLERFRQKHRTVGYPRRAPVLPERFRGLPAIDDAKVGDARAAIEACPVEALATDAAGRLRLDLGRCIFCGQCERACPEGGIVFGRDHRLCARTRDELVITAAGRTRAQTLDAAARRLFGRSLKLRQVSAGGCNACEADTNVLTTVVFDLSRFGIRFTTSPRHADGLLVTGPVTLNMEAALRKTYEAVPAPKIVIAVGACAISGGLFADHEETRAGLADILPVDVFIPGCPPHPVTILDGLLRALGRIE